MENTVTLYRPVGTEELDLIIKSNHSQFPKRREEQPFFYPVLTLEYAIEIARDWNAKYNQDRRGYVTRFQVRSSFLDQYELQIVGASHHQEYWIPSSHLEQFNQNIQGTIQVVAEFFGIPMPNIQKARSSF